MTNKEIGKLEDGSKDPCYDCKHCDTKVCLSCKDYDKAESK